MTDEEACAKLYRDLCDASMRKDADGIAAALADDYTLVHMTGMRQSKRLHRRRARRHAELLLDRARLD